jgi:hypothetical protein
MGSILFDVEWEDSMIYKSSHHEKYLNFENIVRDSNIDISSPDSNYPYELKMYIQYYFYTTYHTVNNPKLSTLLSNLGGLLKILSYIKILFINFELYSQDRLHLNLALKHERLVEEAHKNENEKMNHA